MLAESNIHEPAERLLHPCGPGTMALRELLLKRCKKACLGSGFYGLKTEGLLLQALDFLEQLLVYDGKKRLSARNAALVHP